MMAALDPELWPVVALTLRVAGTAPLPSVLPDPACRAIKEQRGAP
jgi:hypothetical protein